MYVAIIDMPLKEEKEEEFKAWIADRTLWRVNRRKSEGYFKT